MHIVEQVGRLYQRYGIKSVTMDDVARHLGISKKTLYEYFHDKEDLVRSVLELEHGHRCSFFDEIERRELNAIEELLEVYKMLNNIFREHNHSMEYDIRKYYPDLFNRMKEVRRKRMYAATHNNLLKGKREGLYRRDMNAGVIARLHVFRTESMLDNDMFSVEELTSFKVFHEIFVYHLQGILSPRGRTFFETNFHKLKPVLAQ